MERIRKGDEVLVIAGKSKGQKGKVLSRAKNDRVVVEGCNLIKLHIKADPRNPGTPSGIVTREASIHVSNVAHYNPATQKADKVGFRFAEVNGVMKKVRYFKSTSELVDRA